MRLREEVARGSAVLEEGVGANFGVVF